MTEPSVLELAVMEDVEGKKYKYALRRVDGKAVAKPVIPKPNRLNTARYPLEPGIHMLTVSAEPGLQEAYRMRMRMGPAPLDPLAPGQRLGQAAPGFSARLAKGMPSNAMP